MAQSDQFLQSFLVGVVEQSMLDWRPEEGGDIIPILPYGFLRHLVVHFPEFLYLIGKNIELLIIRIFLNRCLPLKTLNDKFEADLRILHAHGHISFKKLRIAVPSQIPPVLVKSFDIVVNLGMSEVNEVPIGGIEEPVVSMIVVFEGDEAHPVVGNGEHEVYYQWLFLAVLLEVVYVLVQFPPLLLRNEDILVLELPSKREELEMVVVPEYLELLEVLQAELVVSPLEIPIEDVLLSPRPLVLQFILLLYTHKEALHFAFKTPEGGTAQNIIVGILSPQQIQKAEGVVGGVISAQIACILLVTLPQMQVILRTVFVLDHVGKGESGHFGG